MKFLNNSLFLSVNNMNSFLLYFSLMFTEQCRLLFPVNYIPDGLELVLFLNIERGSLCLASKKDHNSRDLIDEQVLNRIYLLILLSDSIMN